MMRRLQTDKLVVNTNMSVGKRRRGRRTQIIDPFDCSGIIWIFLFYNRWQTSRRAACNQ